jgi:uncharacterized membrane-anchored protein YhcB (DUF1043 family)
MEHYAQMLDPFVGILVKIIAGIVMAVLGNNHYKAVTSKKELEDIEKKVTTETHAQESFQKLIEDGLAFSYQAVIKQGEKDGKSLSANPEFQKEAETAAVNFIRNTADRYGLGEYVTKLSDEQIITFLRWALGKGRFAVQEAKALVAAKTEAPATK